MNVAVDLNVNLVGALEDERGGTKFLSDSASPIGASSEVYTKPVETVGAERSPCTVLACHGEDGCLCSAAYIKVNGVRLVFTLADPFSGPGEGDAECGGTPDHDPDAAEHMDGRGS